MSRAAVVALLTGVVLASASAHADAIDGSWCRDTGERLAIAGPAIVTPGAARLDGDYSRHAFSYVAPAGEPEAGATVQMRLLNEETMQSRVVRDGAAGTSVTWHRCGPPVS